MEKIKQIVIKYKELILYAIFGVLTTVVNIVTFGVLTWDKVGMHELLANVIAWVVSVAFAFVTNKLFVFESKSFKSSVFWPELFKFSLGRVLTGLLDEGIIALTVTMLHGNALLWKIISNIIVIILNFIISKLLVFKNKK